MVNSHLKWEIAYEVFGDIDERFCDTVRSQLADMDNGPQVEVKYEVTERFMRNIIHYANEPAFTGHFERVYG